MDLKSKYHKLLVTNYETPKQNDFIIDWNQRIRELETRFGAKAAPWIYSKNFTIDFIKEFESAYLKTTIISPTEFNNNFDDKGIFNFPAPFYTVETDTCGIGQIEAGNNILNDAELREHVFIQPRTVRELANVFSAAYMDPFQNYGIDGNEKWNSKNIREWWGNKNKLIELLKTDGIKKQNNGQNHIYISYLNGNAKTDLQRYVYFLENDSYPNEDINKLPEIE